MTAPDHRRRRQNLLHRRGHPHMTLASPSARVRLRSHPHLPAPAAIWTFVARRPARRWRRNRDARATSRARASHRLRRHAAGAHALDFGRQRIEPDGGAPIVDVPRRPEVRRHITPSVRDELRAILLPPAACQQHAVGQMREIRRHGLSASDCGPERFEEAPLGIGMSVGVLGEEPRCVCSIFANAIVAWPSLPPNDAFEPGRVVRVDVHQPRHLGRVAGVGKTRRAVELPRGARVRRAIWRRALEGTAALARDSQAPRQSRRYGSRRWRSRSNLAASPLQSAPQLVEGSDRAESCDRDRRSPRFRAARSARTARPRDAA